MPLLFSYGTLQQEEVQLAIFDRKLRGDQDELVGYEQAQLLIEDPAVIATSGKTHHSIVRPSRDPLSRIKGTVYEISPAELQRADLYEVAAYKRAAAKLASGREAWVYVDARVLGERPG
ncbi:MAG TPA: gamma-glutamylcyclotransferase family protein [Steroidobacteraceae bacterium]|jgi:gamma-glutamylcyclotransferase (GGCT)/AIG2-like uncharacterized protein YtfP